MEREQLIQNLRQENEGGRGRLKRRKGRRRGRLGRREARSCKRGKKRLDTSKQTSRKGGYRFMGKGRIKYLAISAAVTVISPSRYKSLNTAVS